MKKIVIPKADPMELLIMKKPNKKPKKYTKKPNGEGEK